MNDRMMIFFQLTSFHRREFVKISDLMFLKDFVNSIMDPVLPLL